MYIAIRRYQIDRNNVNEVTRHIQGPFLSLLGQEPGFVGYYWLKLGETIYASISIYEDQAGAEKSTKIAADYVRQHLAPLIPKQPEVSAGEVLVYKMNEAGNIGT